ncbi:Hint domain-containing protein [Acidisoma cladoniae]|uniref:Hint domain-containing protein n=1 Tax=Acidisoma cladoniae TaxID=3040935 RepID=UPI00254C2AB5|nr:Hint domain-containing protein [Acidisoma sp. PAMC 29798]
MDVVVTVGGATYTFDFLTIDAAAAASGIANAINAEGGVNTDVVSADGTTFLGSTYDSIVIDALGAATVVAASSVSVIGGSNGIAFYGAAGSTDNIAFAGGANTINAGTGSTYNIATGNGNDLISASGSGSVDAGAGSNTILASGAGSQEITSYGVGDLIALGSGNTTVASGGTGAIIFGGSGADVMADTGTADTVVAGTGAMTIFGGSQGVYLLSSSQSDFVVAGTQPTSSDTIVGAAGGAETVFGGTSDLVFAENSSLLYVASQGSAATISGGTSGNATVFGAAGANIDFYGGSGEPEATLVQGSGAETISAATSQASVVFAGAPGNALLIGGTAPDTFIFSSGGGTDDTIENATEADVFALQNYGSNEVSNDLAHATYSNGNATITTSDGSAFTFIDVTSLTQTSADTFSVACFSRGTRIATSRGEIAVEALTLDDQVLTVDSGPSAIRWIGYRDIDLTRHAAPDHVRPIRVRTGAFGQGRPRRDLMLSPDHAIFVEGVLIPVKYLVNDITIRQMEAETVTYFHIELERHEIVLAEGLPCESYLDTGDRAAFAGGVTMEIHAVWGSEARDVALIMDALGYAPMRVAGPEVELVKAQLASRCHSEEQASAAA